MKRKEVPQVCLLQTCREKRTLTIGEFQFEGINVFNFLGANVNSENTVDEKITKRIIAGNFTYFSLSKLLRSPLLCKGSNMTLYRMFIRPEVTYGAEIWTLETADEEAVRVFERYMVRRNSGPIPLSGEWRLRSSHKIESILGNADIIRFVKSGRIS